MRVRFQRIVQNQYFILDKERIKSLVNVLQSRVGEPSISAVCADEGTRSFESVEDLLQYENPKGRSILSLDFESTNHEEKVVAIIEFRSPYKKILTASGVAITVSGEEDQATIVMKGIEEIVLGIQPWYSWLAKINEIFWIALYLIALYFPFNKLGLFSFSDLNVLDVISISAVAAWMTFGTRYVVRFLFDPAVFMIGQEKSRYQTKEWIRKIIVSVLITLITVLAIIPLIRFVF